MRLESAHIRNFKLLTDVPIKFSTNPDRPLTVIRAENGSGKTSVLTALRWAMYGAKGIPDMRLASTVTPAGETVTVQVRVEFSDHDPYSGAEARYRLIRTCEETPTSGDDYIRTAERLHLFMMTEKGEEEITEGKQGEIEAHLPLSLSNVFFTNGDDVQRFIAGSNITNRERQDSVHKAIRQILGLDNLEKTEQHLGSVAKKLRRDFTSKAGEELRVAQERFDKITEQIDMEHSLLTSSEDILAEIRQQILLDEKELNGIKGIGDLEDIQERIAALNQDIGFLEEQENGIRQEIKDLFASQQLSQSFWSEKIDKGIERLATLADRHIIPGQSVEVLVDRLELGICICGEQISPGDSKHNHIAKLISEQQEIAPRIQRLTALWHEARNFQTMRVSSANQQIKGLQERFTQTRDLRRRKAEDRRIEEEKRKGIDQERVKQLTERIELSRKKEAEQHETIGELRGRVSELEEERKIRKARVDEAERVASLQSVARRKSIVAEDLWNIAKGTFDRLKSIYIQRVSSKMNERFLDIVGADSRSDTNLYAGVDIDDSTYDIVIHTTDGKTLDADNELNGAAQRALTLSFIWALMEVAEKEAPRIIDTPLGMTSGAVKHRMVEILTRPVQEGGLPYQPVLLMTRSEIRDIEHLISERVGIAQTLSCSKDYPRELVNDWSLGNIRAQACSCDHTQFCEVCERRNDSSLGLRRRGDHN